MQRFKWDESLSVGVDFIDEQHKEWISRLNSLSEAIESRHDLHVVSKVLAFMIDYLKFHFAAEEEHMAATDYPAMAQHKLAHDEFRKVVADLLALELGQGTSFNTLCDFVNNFQISWLLKHIDRVDRQFALYLREKDAAL